MLRHSGNEPCGASNIAGLAADRVDTAVDDIVDEGGVDIDTVKKFNDRRRPKVSRMHIGQTASATTNWGANGIDDVGLGHGGLLGVDCDQNDFAEVIGETTPGSDRQDRAGTMAEQALVDSKPNLGIFHLMAIAASLQLPREFTHLSNGLCGNCFAK
ncbi:unannotated protein [freshwater metagenome]|uniref:Unannotated protein n=1 Tax=freshwater metagenome TaxID=449393 RepID=A0A6J6RJW9_9ZZZZ